MGAPGHRTLRKSNKIRTVNCSPLNAHWKTSALTYWDRYLKPSKINNSWYWLRTFKLSSQRHYQPLKNTTRVARNILEHCVVNYGILTELRNKRGRQLMYKLFVDVRGTLGVTSMTTTEYHLRGNGQNVLLSCIGIPHLRQTVCVPNPLGPIPLLVNLRRQRAITQVSKCVPFRPGTYESSTLIAYDHRRTYQLKDKSWHGVGDKRDAGTKWASYGATARIREERKIGAKMLRKTS